MITKKKDRRISYTNMMLKNSLIELISEKPINKISVKELCEKADINRCTFYSHFEDIYDLVHHVENEIFEEMKEFFENYNYRNSDDEAVKMIALILDKFVSNSKLCSILLSKNGELEFQKSMITMLQEQLIKDWFSNSQIKDDFADYRFQFAVHGSLGIIQHWLETGMKLSTKQVSEVIISLSSQGIVSAKIGIDNLSR